MLIRPHDAASDEECRELLRSHDFGQLVAAGSGREVPVVVPTHFVYDGDATISLHLAKPNPVWDAIAENPVVLLTVIADWTYIRTDWNAAPGSDPTYGIPTSYYASVQAKCHATPLDEPGDIASTLTTQLGHFQPDGGHGGFDDEASPYSKSLRAIRGLRLDVLELVGKFKYGGNKDEHHRDVIGRLLDERGGPGDRRKAGSQNRRCLCIHVPLRQWLAWHV